VLAFTGRAGGWWRCRGKMFVAARNNPAKSRREMPPTRAQNVERRPHGVGRARAMDRAHVGGRVWCTRRKKGGRVYMTHNSCRAGERGKGWVGGRVGAHWLVRRWNSCAIAR